MAILLTGGTGYLGGRLVKYLYNEKRNLVLLKRKTSDLNCLGELKNNLVFYDVDVDKNEVDHHFFKNINIILHLATEYGHCKTKDDIYNVNVKLPLDILSKCIKNGCKYFINTDTYFSKKKNYSYLSNYIKSKIEFIQKSKNIIKDKNFVFINLQLEHMYGPNDSQNKFVNWLISQLINDNNLDLTIGKQKRDFIYIDDVVTGYSKIISNLNSFEAGFHQVGLGTGVGTSIYDFVTYAHKLSNSNSILKFGAIDYRKHELMISTADISVLNSLSWSAKIGYKKGVEKLLSEYKI